MPYKCNVCGKLYAESSPELKDVMLRGSCSCGKRFLMYIRRDQQERPVRFEATPEEKIMESPYLPEVGGAEKPVEEPRAEETPSPYLPQPEAQAAGETKGAEEPKEEGPLDWLESNFVKITKKEEPMYLSIETIKILEEGKYQIDVSSLMGGKPVIVEDADGVYYIDVPYAMKKKGRVEGL